MRFIPQLLALLLAISSIAVPCVAKTQIGKSAPSGSVSVEIDADECMGSCIKAIVSRENDHDLAVIIQNSAGEVGFVPQQRQLFPVSKTASVVLKPPNAVCSSPVNLYKLCRQLN